MVKLTIVGRISDGLPIAQGLRYINDENYLWYKQQAEFLLKEFSRGALSPTSRIIIPVDHNRFNCLVEDGMCFITLCDSSYPRKLIFLYLKDLQQEFNKFDTSLVANITKPYSFVKFGSVIGNIRNQYIDTRTQVNLSRINEKRGQDQDLTIVNMAEIIERLRRPEILERMVSKTSQSNVSPLWGSRRLEVIATKWTPITIIIIVASLLLWVSLILTNNGYIFMTF